MSVITKTGDRGSTSLFNGDRVLKSDLRVQTYGMVDQLNSQIGLLVSQPYPHPSIREESHRLLPVLDRMIELLSLKVQPELFNIGAILATPMDSEAFRKLPPLSPDGAEQFEELVKEAETHLPRLKHFIMPRGNLMAAQAHVARTICRQAESHVVGFFNSQGTLEKSVCAEVVVFLNRLSDFCFILARVASNIERYNEEHLWVPNRRPGAEP
ncbi:MAG: cob(I)yrinic acid a,c-diamide adenosyltransferase [Verrucomicrobiae bacterium]|nr:cob(I)yrinic acid a,c-diamide adenosyltransferase [Verrucomicrobiae bacterium]